MNKEKSIPVPEIPEEVSEFPAEIIEDEQDYGSWDTRDYDDYPYDLPLDFEEHPDIADELADGDLEVPERE